MKVISVTLLLVLMGSFAGAHVVLQDSTVVEVVKFSWNKERIGWERDPFGGPIENFDEVRARTRNEKRIEDAKRGNSAEIDKIRTEAKADAANIETKHQNAPARYVFVYKATVKNKSNKTIKLVDWDYIFRDESNGTEINRQQFTSEERIAPSKAKELTVIISKPPTQTISVTSLNTSERDSLKGQVVLMKIEFTDGTIWQQPY